MHTPWEVRKKNQVQVFRLQATEKTEFQSICRLPRVRKQYLFLLKITRNCVYLLTFLSNVNRDVWRGFSDEKKNSFVYLDCLWFSMYKSENHNIRSSVFDSVKTKQIFSKKYVFLPIVYWLVNFAICVLENGFKCNYI